MQCRICGKNAQYHVEKHAALCATCARETPDKVSFNTFRFTMWPAVDRIEYGSPTNTTERAFYDDYLCSISTLHDYMQDVRA